MLNLAELIDAIEPASEAYRQKARAHLEDLAIPRWSLGRLLDLAVDLAGMTRSLKPAQARRVVLTCGGDHGVVQAGVSAFGPTVTAAMMRNFATGGASINALAAAMGATLKVVDFGVATDLSPLGEAVIDCKIAPGTRNFAVEPAMSREQAELSVSRGATLVAELANDFDIFCTGDMGIGNTTPSAAITASLLELPAEAVTGRGSGVDETRLAKKVAVVREALRRWQPDSADALDVLSKVGGFEIGGLAGIFLGAAVAQKPVVIDGFIAGAAALLAQQLCPAAADYMIAGHLSAEGGHRRQLAALQKEPLLSLDFRLGEGTGAVMALPIIKSAVATLSGIKTFSELGFAPE